VIAPGRPGWRPGAPVLAAAVALSASAACTDGSPSPPLAHVADSAGVRIVTIPAEGFEQPAPLRIGAEAHLRVGSMDGPETEYLTAPGAVARLSDGRIFLTETGGRRARLLDPDGGFIRWIGQVGDGPAEYRNVSGGGVLPGDTLWVHDGGRSRVVLFGPDGGLVRATSYDLPDGPHRALMVRPLPDGTLVHAGLTLGSPASMTGGDRITERIRLHLFPPGEEPRLVLDHPGASYDMREQEGQGGMRMVMMMPADPTFSPVLRIEAGPSGDIWAGNGDGFEVRRVEPSGAPVEIFRGELPPVTFSAADRREFERISVERAPEQAREGLRMSLAQREYAQVLPAFSRLVADEVGRLWVPEFSAHRPGEQPRSWWVLEPDGDLLGRVELPPGLRVLLIRDDEILGVETDEYDVPYLVGYPLEDVP
jgi:hypothetical protein